MGSNVDYFEAFPLNPSIILSYNLSPPNAQYYVPPCKQTLPTYSKFKLGYWGLISPALFGAAGALSLSLFSEIDHLIARCEGTLFKLAIVWYAIGASVAASFAVTDVCSNSKDPHDKLLRPILGALVSIILLFAAEYLLLYRSFPSSFKGDLGDLGDNFCIQLVTFLYLSITIIPGASVGDIMPDNLTARALIGTEIAFYLFTMATATQLILARYN